MLAGGYFIFKEDINKSFNKNPKEIVNIPEEIDNDSLLLDAINNKKKVIYKDKEVFYKDIVIVDKETADVDKYAFVDFDNDDNNELVVLTTLDYGAYVLLHRENDKVYANVIGIRSMNSLKKDGTFKASSGADNFDIATLKFDGEKCENKVLATFDKENKIYEINDKKVKLAKIEEYIK